MYGICARAVRRDRTYRGRVSEDAPHDVPVRPRSGRRALRSAAISGAVGTIVVLASLITAVETGSTSWSVANVSWILFGAATGAVFGPLFTLARDDGTDADAVRHEVVEHGRADTSLEGAQAHDLRRRGEG
jgi:hypothetical protein